MNSMSPGISSLAHCRRMGLPEEDDRTRVFAQWAAVNNVWPEHENLDTDFELGTHLIDIR